MKTRRGGEPLAAGGHTTFRDPLPENRQIPAIGRIINHNPDGLRIFCITLLLPNKPVSIIDY
jgi:hypothetical protein